MGMSGPDNPFGHPDPMVDRMIGTAYDKVKFVASNLGPIILVANALNGVAGTEPMITSRTAIVTGKLGELGSENQFDLPENVDPASVVSVTARVQTGDNTYVFFDQGSSSIKIEDGKLVISIAADAPAEYVNASVHWFLISQA